MAESVNTGGLKRFVYNEKDKPKLTPEQEREIKEAWEKHYIKKEKRKANRNRLIMLAILLLAIYLIWKYILK
jgi:hypothetical protein